MQACLMKASSSHTGDGKLAWHSRPDASNKQLAQVWAPSEMKAQLTGFAAIRRLEPNELFVGVWTHCEQSHLGIQAAEFGL